MKTTGRHFHVHINSRAVGECCDHVTLSLCDSPTVLPAGSVKPVFSLSLVSIKREHPLHILKHIIKHVTAEGVLEVPPVCFFVGLKVALEMSFIVHMRVVSMHVSVSEYIVKVEAKMLTEVVPASSRALPGERTAPCLVVLLPPVVI